MAVLTRTRSSIAQARAKQRRREIKQWITAFPYLAPSLIGSLPQSY